MARIQVKTLAGPAWLPVVLLEACFLNTAPGRLLTGPHDSQSVQPPREKHNYALIAFKIFIFAFLTFFFFFCKLDKSNTQKLSLSHFKASLFFQTLSSSQFNRKLTPDIVKRKDTYLSFYRERFPLQRPWTQSRPT